MSSTPNSTVEASTTSSSPASCMASNNNAPKYGTRVPNRVFVGGLTPDTTQTEMESLFSTYGTVTSVKIISDRAGVSKGYGFITFETEEQARNLLRLQELYLKDRKLNIAPAIKKQYDPCATLQPSPYGRGAYDMSPSPNVPTGSVYYSNAAVQYAALQTNGLSYYPAGTAVVTQQDAYNAAANATYTQAAAQATNAAVSAHAYPGYPYIYPAAAAAQAMYATPQQYSYQALQPPMYPPPLHNPDPIVHSSDQSSPPSSFVVPSATTFPSPPSQQAAQMPSHSFIMGDLPVPFSVPYTMLPLPILMTEHYRQPYNSGDTVQSADMSIVPTTVSDNQEESEATESLIFYDNIYFTTPPPPIMTSATPSLHNTDPTTSVPNVYIPTVWTPVSPPSSYFSSPETPHSSGWPRNGNGRGRSGRNSGRRGGRGGGGGGRRSVGPSGDCTTSPEHSRYVPPRRQHHNALEYSNGITSCHNNNDVQDQQDLIKMVQALTVNN